MDSLAHSFDRAAQDYERGRPGWPPEVAEVAGVSEAATVLDLAAGTGKLTRLLVQRFERVIAIEPLDGMRELLQALVPEARVAAGRAEAIPLPDASVDAVFVAEAFHWFDGESALREIGRVLRPNGVLVLLWNRPAEPTRPRLPAEVVEEINRLFDAAENPIQEYESGEWREPFDRSPFGPLESASLARPAARVRARQLDADEYVRRWRAEVHSTRLQP